MPKWTVSALVCLVLSLFILSMAATPWLKRPLSPEEDIIGLLDQMASLTVEPEPDWESLNSLRGELKTAWERVRFRIQFSAEKDDIIRINRSLDELPALIILQDYALVLQRIELIRSIFHGM